MVQVKGFQFAGLHCGIKDNLRKKDLALIFSEEPDTLVDGVFTTNRVCAAPVKLCRRALGSGRARLVVINSGIANACTGKRGMQDALRTQKAASRMFAVPAAAVFICSTGKIGDFLPMEKLLPGLKKAKRALNPSGFAEAARAIMTTDRYPKYAASTGQLGGRKYTLAVLAKGAGMLSPSMATMLSFVVTDLCFTRAALREVFRKAVDETLNRVTVDGDTSTNDTALMLANGRAGNAAIRPRSAAARKIRRELTALLEKMARSIALDGEGATTCCAIIVRGARSDRDARKIAYAIGNSPLVKTALFGRDPNWGRIMAAIGYSGAKVREEKIRIRLGPHIIAKSGRGIHFDQRAVTSYMRRKNTTLVVDCGVGNGSFHVYAADLTYAYININAEYHT